MGGNRQDDLAIASFGTMVRGSAAMFARRRRILSVARRMMAEGGAEGLAMRELARRADVSLRTLYNAFGSKERLIVAAIRQYFDRFLRAVCDDRDPYHFQSVIETIIAINLRNQQIRPYLAALVAINFSPLSDPAIRVELRRTAAGFLLPWLEFAHASGQLAPGTDIQRVTTNLANLQYAMNQEWLSGVLADDVFVPTILDGVLTYLRGCLRNEAAREAETLLADIHGDRRIAHMLIADTRERLNDLFAGSNALWPVDGMPAPASPGMANADATADRKGMAHGQAEAD